MNRLNTAVLSKAYWLFTAASALAAAIIGSIAMGVSFDPSVGYFDTGVLTVLMLVISAFAVVGAVVAPCLTLGADTMPPLRAVATTSVATRCFCLLLAFQAAFYGIATLIKGISHSDTSVFVWIGAIAAIGSAVHFAFITRKEAAKHPTITLLLGIFPIAWGLAVIGDTYFDMTVAMNSPIKLAIQFGFACLMLSMTTELRIHLGEPAPRLAMAIRGMTAFVGLGAGTTLIVSINILHDKQLLIHGVSLWLIGLYALMRMADDAFRPLPPADEAVTVNRPADEAVADEVIAGEAVSESDNASDEM